MAKRIRQGNDIVIRWAVTRAGQKEDFTDKTVTVKLNAADGTCVPIEYEAADGLITVRYYGKDQAKTGLYSLTLIENDGERMMGTIDVPNVFRIVVPQCVPMKDEDSTACCDVDIDAVDIATELSTPQGIEIYEKMNALVGEWADGKAEVVDALNRQGQEADMGDTFGELSQKIMDIPKRFDGEDGSVDWTNGGTMPMWDLLNELHRNKRADHQYICGMMIYDSDVVLSGADAYLCSDGFYTEEQGVEHHIDDTAHIMPYVIFYFDLADYAVPNINKDAYQVMALNGRPVFKVKKSWLNIYSFTDERYETSFEVNKSIRNMFINGVTSFYNAFTQTSMDILYLAITNCRKDIFINSNSATKIFLPQLTTVSGGTVVYNCQNFTQLELPQLTTVSGGNVVRDCVNLTSLTLPSLTTVSGGQVVTGCNNFTSLTLPSLTTVSGGYVVGSCNNFTSLTLPSLTTVSGGTVVRDCFGDFYFPKLEYSSNVSWFQFSIDFRRDVNIYLPVMDGYVVFSGTNNSGYKSYEAKVHLGRQDGCNITIKFVQTGNLPSRFTEVTVESGFRSDLDLSQLPYLTAESIVAIIGNLGDNNAYEAKTLTLGATNIAKLTEEQIAVATSKNYTIK